MNRAFAFLSLCIFWGCVWLLMQWTTWLGLQSLGLKLKGSARATGKSL